MGVGNSVAAGMRHFIWAGYPDFPLSHRALAGQGSRPSVEGGLNTKKIRPGHECPGLIDFKLLKSGNKNGVDDMDHAVAADDVGLHNLDLAIEEDRAVLDFDLERLAIEGLG